MSMACNRHTIEQTQLRRQHRVDGVGRPKCDFHTGSKHYGPGQQLYLPRDALSEDDVVLVVDDFLASGSCQEAMFRLVARAGARPAGLAVLVEKTFDGGRDFLSAWPVPVASLAAIVSVDNGYIELLEEESFDDVGILDIGDDADETVFGLDFLPVGGDP